MALARLGYFEGFKSSNTLLLDGDHEGLAQLERVFRALAAGQVESVAVHALPFVEAHHHVRLVAQLSVRDFGVSMNAGQFRWHRTGEGWQEAADRISAVTRSRGHHYLDAPRDEVTVMVSSGEYGSEWWTKNG